MNGLATVAPVPNVVLEPEARPTTILYYLYPKPGLSRPEAVDLANRFARQHVAPQAPPSAYVGVTGSQPAAEVRSNIIPDRLP